MKLWLLDADVIIDLLGLGIFADLVKKTEIFTSETVAQEVRYYKKGDKYVPIDFRAVYVSTKKVTIDSAPVEEIADVRNMLPGLGRESIDAGELESLAILRRESSLTFCSCDAAAIRALPLIGCSERGVSIERLPEIIRHFPGLP